MILADHPSATEALKPATAGPRPNGNNAAHGQPLFVGMLIACGLSLALWAALGALLVWLF